MTSLRVAFFICFRRDRDSSFGRDAVLCRARFTRSWSQSGVAPCQSALALAAGLQFES